MKGLLSALPFFSDKRPESDKQSELGAEVIIQGSSSESEGGVQGNGLSGVSKYVNNMPVVTGVNRYIGRQEEKEPVYQGPSTVEEYIGKLPKETGVMRYLAANEGNVLSGVTKYLKRQEDTEASSVAKYVASQLVNRGNQPKISGVEAYLNQQNLVVKEKPETASSVEEYMAKNVRSAAESTVGKYIAKKSLATRVKFDVTGVDKYQLEQELIAKKKAAEEIVARYLEEQKAALVEEQAEAEFEAAAMAAAAIAAQKAEELAQAEMKSDDDLSAVARYMKKQAALAEDRPAATGVSKYLIGKMLEERKKPAVSGVAKYLAGQKTVEKDVVEASSVDKYLQSKELADKEVPALSGVEKYVSTKTIVDSHKPEVSGVARYMARVRYVMDVAVAVVGKSLEGEFIPAGQEFGETSVGRYLDKKDILDKASKPSGVSQYLDSRPVVIKERDVSTSVDLYLEEQAVVARETRVSGVEKYLANNVAAEEQVQAVEEASVDEVEPEVVEPVAVAELSGVDKYLQSQPEPEMVEEEEMIVELSSVDKYMAEKAVLDKKIAMENATGVEKYLMSAAN